MGAMDLMASSGSLTRTYFRCLWCGGMFQLGTHLTCTKGLSVAAPPVTVCVHGVPFSLLCGQCQRS